MEVYLEASSEILMDTSLCKDLHKCFRRNLSPPWDMTLTPIVIAILLLVCDPAMIKSRFFPTEFKESEYASRSLVKSSLSHLRCFLYIGDGILGVSFSLGSPYLSALHSLVSFCS